MESKNWERSQNHWNVFAGGSDISLMFDTGAALRVCPLSFGEEFPTYQWQGHSGIVGADGPSTRALGILTIVFRLLPDKDGSVGITFALCNVQEPSITFSQVLRICYRCALTLDTLEQQFATNCKIPMHQEGHHCLPQSSQLHLGHGSWSCNFCFNVSRHTTTIHCERFSGTTAK